MFGARRCPGNEVIEDGAKVLVFAEVSFYEVRGTTQLLVRKARAVGVGDLQARFEALKKKLAGEGLFASEKKKPLPFFPRRIGIVTSGSGAALQDIINVLNRRAPWLEVVVFSTAVQGAGAENSIARRIAEADRYQPALEALIVGRGGGSLEDLWNFNEEVVARAIAAAKILVVSAVGHEIDFTIADFVADLRAPTPSAAAELIAPSHRELSERLELLRYQVVRRTQGRIERAAQRLDYVLLGPLGKGPQGLIAPKRHAFEYLRQRLVMQVRAQLNRLERQTAESRILWQQFRPERQLEKKRLQLHQARQQLVATAITALNRDRQKLALVTQKVRLLSPTSTLERGFSIALNQEGEAVTNPDQVANGEQLNLMTAGGSLAVKANRPPKKKRATTKRAKGKT